MIDIQKSVEARRIGRIALGDIVHRSARRAGSRIAVIDGDERLTHAELDARSSQFAHFLCATLPKGGQVATLCENSAELLVAMNGIHKAGDVWVPVNIKLDVAQIGYILRHAEVVGIVADEDVCLEPKMAALLTELGLPVVVTRATGKTSVSTLTFSEALHGRPDHLPDVDIDADQPALIMYTSGTTGNPKGVVHTHGSVHYALIANIATFGYSQADVVSCMLPLFHCGQHNASAAALAAGASLVIARGFNPGNLIADIVERRVSVIVGLPMMYGAVLAHPSAQSADFSSLRLCVYAMAPMSQELVAAISQRMCPNLMLATGQTEIYPVTMSYHRTLDDGRNANYWGVSTSIVETAIMDDEGNLLPPGEVGEIVHRGPNVMLGYFKDAEATAAAQKFGWHHTGDIGMFDEGGQLQFLDRKKDMIKTGGENVASIKVESAILGHPAVASVAVLGLPHPHWSEAICAVVVLKPDMPCSEAELDAWCRERLGKFEVPKAIRFVEQLPVTATGKIRKQVLRSQFEGLFHG